MIKRMFQMFANGFVQYIYLSSQKALAKYHDIETITGLLLKKTNKKNPPTMSAQIEGKITAHERPWKNAAVT